MALCEKTITNCSMCNIEMEFFWRSKYFFYADHQMFALCDKCGLRFKEKIIYG